MQTRRNMLVSAMATAATMLAPLRVHARFFSKMSGWKTLFDVVVGGVSIIEFLRNTLGSASGGGAAQQPICKVRRGDLERIHRLCFQLAIATNTKDYRISIERGDGGLLPALVAFVDTPKDSTWRRVRNDAMVFTNTLQQLLAELGRENGAVEALDPDSRARILSEVRAGLRVVNEAVWLVYSIGDEGDSPGAAKEALAFLEKVPELLDRAQRAAAELVDLASKTRC